MGKIEISMGNVASFHEGLAEAHGLRGKAVAIYAEGVLFLHKSKTSLKDAYMSFASLAHADGQWPDKLKGGEIVLDDDGHKSPMGLNAAMKLGCTKAAEWDGFRCYANCAEQNDKGVPKVKDGKIKLDPSKKVGNNAMALVNGGHAEGIKPRVATTSSTSSTPEVPSAQDNVEALINTLFNQFKDEVLPEDMSTFGDVIAELATMMDIRLK